MTKEDDEGTFDATMDDPPYKIQARLAEMYREGGFDLEANPSKAGMGTCMVGRLGLDTRLALMYRGGFDLEANPSKAGMGTCMVGGLVLDARPA